MDDDEARRRFRRRSGVLVDDYREDGAGLWWVPPGPVIAIRLTRWRWWEGAPSRG